jgi:plastocyanin
MAFPSRRRAALGLLPPLLLAGCLAHPGAAEPVPRPTAPTQPAPAAPTAAAAPQPAADGNKVVIDNFTFSPATLTVPAGTAVTWVNHDDVPHTVTSPSRPRLLDSPTLDTDQSFTHVFKDPGTYDYYCTVHPRMTGQVIVK